VKERGIVLFSLDGQRLAAAAQGVRRIESPATSPREGWIGASSLGAPALARRGLVAAQGDEERVLAVDEVEGIERIPASSIHDLPRLARSAMRVGGVEGLVHREDELLLLIDLPLLVFETIKELRPDGKDE
jgi:chemotaxis signal transduction protein